MAKQIHVNGECLLRIFFPSAPSVPQDLGYTVNGVDLEIRKHTFDVKADTGGGDDGGPVDIQVLGKEAIIRAELVSYDKAVLALIRKDADETTEGLLASAGKLMGAGGYFYRLLLTSPVENEPWNFPTATLVDSYSVKLGTKRTVWNLTFRAIAYIGANASLNTVLYNQQIT
jgi:hypothetical protein